MQYEELVEILPLGAEGEMVLGLDAMFQLMEALGNPQNQIPMIHIAGTNGKGSTAAFVNQVLQEAGYKVGLFTSPSLVEFNERIRVNSQPISDSELMAYAKQIQEAVEGTDLEMTEFELFAALAFLCFSDQCDIAIIEVGLGGRLDATNVIASPAVTAIMKIGLDHTAILGDSLEEIATEKAEIIKPNCPVVVYPQESLGVREVISEKAQSQDAPMTVVDLDDIHYTLSNEPTQDFQYKDYMYQIKALEEHQIINASVALEICFALQKAGWDIAGTAIDQGLAEAVWPARFEWLSENPDVIIDGSHNEDGLTALKANLYRYFPSQRRIGIIGFMSDKAIDGPLKDLLEEFEVVITVTPDSPRALSAQTLKEKVESLTHSVDNQEVYASQSLEDALNYAADLAQADDLIAIFGSFYFVGHVRQMILAGRNEEV